MKSPLPLRAIFLALGLVLTRPCAAQTGSNWNISGSGPQSQFETENGTNYFTHGVMVSNETAVVTADTAAANELTGDVDAQGDVTILDHGHIWRGTNFIYNFKTGQVRAGRFKTFQTPFALAGENLHGRTNADYTATNAIISPDDVEKPAYTIRAKRIIIEPGVRFRAYHAWLYLGPMPVFYYPYYQRSLKQNQNNFEFSPGDRSIFGPYLLSAYNWYGYEHFDGTLHVDEREKRGLAAGPDLLFHFGDAGDAALKYYFADDHDPMADGLDVPDLKHHRQRASLAYNVAPWTNTTLKVIGNYQSDPLVIRDFFENEYNENVQPRSFAEGTRLGDNYVLDAMAEPRLVDFFETVERLPDVRLEELRQQVGVTPIYYESETSAGYYNRAFSNTNIIPNALGLYPAVGPVTNTPSYMAGRADTVHQLTLPETFFGWLNVTPRLAGRLTYYSDVTGLNVHTNEQVRAAMETGMDVAFKASRVYEGAESSLLDVHELRHIIQPEVDYGYAPAPTRSASQVPQFDYQAPSLRLSPIEFPEYNSIDSLTSQNVLRLMLRNRLQTKRDGRIDTLLDWAIYTDWNISPGTNASFADLYNDIVFRPRSWLTLASSTRYDLQDPQWREAINSLTIQPTTVWSLTLNYYYLMNNDPEFLAYTGQTLPGHNLVGASFYYRLNENWAMNILERYEAQNGDFQEQDYTVYRDFRSWTGALTFRLTQGPGQPDDYTVAFTFSLKSFPRFNEAGEPPLDRLNTSSVTDPLMN